MFSHWKCIFIVDWDQVEVAILNIELLVFSSFATTYHYRLNFCSAKVGLILSWSHKSWFMCFQCIYILLIHKFCIFTGFVVKTMKYCVWTLQKFCVNGVIALDLVIVVWVSVFNSALLCHYLAILHFLMPLMWFGKLWLIITSSE